MNSIIYCILCSWNEKVTPLLHINLRALIFKLTNTWYNIYSPACNAKDQGITIPPIQFSSVSNSGIPRTLCTIPQLSFEVTYNRKQPSDLVTGSLRSYNIIIILHVLHMQLLGTFCWIAFSCPWKHGFTIRSAGPG